MTLIEVIMVMAILSIVMMAVMSLYIPAVQSTTVQTQVTDVQSNLRLAVDRMTRDLLMAGFLVAEEPIIFESGTVDDPVDLTLRTRSLIGGFGRVTSATNTSTTSVLTMSSSDMLSYFPDETSVRLFNPVDMSELVEYDEADAALAQQHVYAVKAGAVGVVTINHGGILNGISPSEFEEALLIRVRDNQQPPLQSIRYRIVDGSLQRTINGTTVQILSRGVNALQFSYDRSTASGRVNKVGFTLQGQTKEFKGTIKTRQLRSSVTLRNVF